MMKVKKILFCFYFIFTALQGFSQDKEVDSLKAVIASAKEDTNKVISLIELSKRSVGLNSAQAIIVALEAKDLAQKLSYGRGVAKAFKYAGNGYYNQGKYIEAIEFWNRSMDVFDSIGEKSGVANMLSNLGVVYNVQGLNDSALTCLLKALKISEQLADSFRIAATCLNIGNIYQDNPKTWDKAIEYYLQALPISERLVDPTHLPEEIADMTGSINMGIGEVYLFNKKDIPALFYFKKALDYVKGKEAEQYALNDLGKAYLLRKDYNSAIKYHQQAFELSKKLDSRRDMTKAMLGLGIAYQEQGNFSSAIDAYKQAQALGEELRMEIELKDIYNGLAASYSQLHDYSNAFKYQVLLTSVKDSIYSIESDKKLASMQYDYDLTKKQGQLDLKELDLKKQKVIRNITIGGLTVVMMFFVIVFFQKKRITKEKKRSDELLLNILPEETAEELKATGTAKAKSFDMVSVLFTDFKNFTQASEKLSPEELVEEINHCYSEFDKIITRHGIEKIKTIGDAYMCAGGLPVTNSTHPVDVVKAGLEMQEFIAKNKKEREEKGQPFFELRLGIHTGPVVAGIVGIKKFAYDIWGDTVNTASRMESSGEIGKVNISEATYELIRDQFICTNRGKIKAKNKGEIEMYFVERAV
jgi:adenylate cyclase